MHRAYALLDIKEVSSEQDCTRISGIASTPTTDRMGDIVEPMGAKFAVPMPLLWQHDAHAPVGHVEFARPTKKGIPFSATLPHVKEPGRLKDRIDEAIQSLKYRLVGAVSIGFRPINEAIERIETGLRFKEWEWLELSLVTIPANSEATISTVKALDHGAAASGHTPARLVPFVQPAAVAAKQLRPEGQTTMNIQEQIRQREATHAALVAQQTTIMEKASGEGRTLDTAEREAFDAIAPDVDSVLGDIARLRKMETAVLPKAVAVSGSSARDGEQSRGGISIVSGRSQVPKGIPFVRYAMALANSRGSISDALMFARRWKDSTPEVLRALEMKANAGTTTDADFAAPLATPSTLAAEFMELLRPATILGKLNLHTVPFNTRIIRQLTGSTIAWVGESLPKPVGELTFDSFNLLVTKVAGIVVISEELARLSTPSAESTVKADMIKQTAQFLDQQFLDPAITATAGVRPASITNGADTVAASGTDAAALRCDLRDLFGLFTAANISTSGSALIMRETMGTSIGMMVNALGQVEFTGLSSNGGNLAGLTVVTSENVPDGLIVLVKQDDILLADDGQVTVDTSREATLDMAGGTAPAFSLWQRNCVGIRAERWINWQKARTESVAYITGADYGACEAP